MSSRYIGLDRSMNCSMVQNAFEVNKILEEKCGQNSCLSESLAQVFWFNLIVWT